jgi:Phosphofructokinase
MTANNNKCTRDSTAAIALGSALVLTAVTAFTTYHFTKRSEEKKQTAIIFRQYQREKMLKEKTAAARLLAQTEPTSGTLLEDVKVDRVYLWECQDLRKKFTSSGILNKMKFAPNPVPLIRSPLLRLSAGMVATESMKFTTSDSHRVWEQDYNKLITDHECILGQIVRKPNMVSYTVSYMRAGPRKYLHFDPSTVSAAIVTCGGLCPGLNNVIRELVHTLHQLYGIGGKVYGIQGGYRGFYDDSPQMQPIVLTPALVENIHHEGGTWYVFVYTYSTCLFI